MEKKTKSHQDLPALKGKSVMEDLELPNLFCVEVAESVASLQITSGLSLWNNPRFIFLSFFQHDSAKQCRRRLQYRHWLRNYRRYSNSVSLCHKWTQWGNFHLHSHLPLKSSVTCFGKCERGRFYPRKEVRGMKDKDTTIQSNRCVFDLVCGRTDGQRELFKCFKATSQHVNSLDLAV